MRQRFGQQELVLFENPHFLCPLVPVYLKVNFAVDDRDQPVYENYSGGRLFVSEDKGSRLWVGPQSSLGKLIGVVNEYFDFSGKLRELPDKLKG
jgi:hypothetical protein